MTFVSTEDNARVIVTYVDEFQKIRYANGRALFIYFFFL